jgi:predicted O-linked N-acetylglucosamine transferase (SPINDLY family)
VKGAAQLLERAIALHQRGSPQEAEPLYREILASVPDHFDALHLLGVSLHQQGNHEAAVASIGRALAINPADPSAYSNLALALRNLGRLDEALASLDRALSIRADHVQAHNNRGNVLRAMNRPGEALASYERALAIKPDHAAAQRSRGDVLLDLNRPQDALAAFDRLLALHPRDAVAWNLHGIALGDLGRYEDAVASYDRALAISPQFGEAEFNRGSALLDLKRHEAAASAFGRLAGHAPEHPFVRGQWLHAKMLACDWDRLGAIADAVVDDVRAGRRSAEPFGFQAISTAPADLKRCAQIFAQARYPAAPAVWRGERYDHRRIRIGYVSGELRQQATSMLMAELFEQHDRARFELFAFDNGWSDDSPLRRRIERAFGGTVDITGAGDADAAAMIRAREIDILVNLNGYFGRLRQGVFAHRPAPIQVNYLGFPGTLGADYIDYLIADTRVIPPAEDEHYVERIVRLPDSYQANDSTRTIATRTPARAEAGLPDTGFVFCCFNNNYKITPEVFDVWMRLLGAVQGSVLWLFEDNAAAARNLRREAERRGVASSRIVFASRLPPDEHLARHRLADLFVDTLPYNAHTTASDALWAGLPVITVSGTTFAGRVAGSLLHAAGLPELVTGSLADYERLALELATTPGPLAALRERLAANRDRCALFNADRFRWHIESAYETMWQRSSRGESPAAFCVEAA